MPRSGWKKPESDRRLPDLVSVGLLMKVFPAEVVDEVIAECGRTEQRRRSLPARSMAYFAMGMALHSEGSYEDVLALISDGIAWAHRDEATPKLANKAAISHARDRLGPEPMALLFERVAEPLADADAPGCWLAGRRLVAIDGTCLDLADRGFYSFKAWQTASATGADLLWRVKDNLKLEMVKDLPDGSWLVESN